MFCGDVRDLQRYLNPEAEHYLDWFHVTMRLTVMGQYAKGLPEKTGEAGEELARRANRLRVPLHFSQRLFILKSHIAVAQEKLEKRRSSAQNTLPNPK